MMTFSPKKDDDLRARKPKPEKKENQKIRATDYGSAQNRFCGTSLPRIGGIDNNNVYVSEENQLILWLKTNGDTNIGGFHLHILVYPLVYQLYARMTVIVKSTFWNPAELFIFIAFDNHFKYFDTVHYLKQEASFASIFLELEGNDNSTLIKFNHLIYHLNCHSSSRIRSKLTRLEYKLTKK